jgi:hypothetical protein
VISMHAKNYEEITLNIPNNKSPFKVNLSADRKDDFKKWLNYK